MTGGPRRPTRAPFALWMPVLSAGLVGCLLHPGGRAAHHDGGQDGDLGHDDAPTDGASETICAGAGAPVDPLTTSPCGSGSSIGSDFSGNPMLVSQGGTLTAGVTMGNIGCAWSIDDGASFHGVVVHVTSATIAPEMGQAMLTLSDGGDDTIGFQVGSDGQLTANGYWGTQPVGAQLTLPFCARIHVVQQSGSGAVFVEGQVDDGSGWQTVATGDWFPTGSGQVSIGVSGMSTMATFDHFDYVAP